MISYLPSLRASAVGLLTGLMLSHAAVAEPPPVKAERPWARATAPRQAVGGSYVTLTSGADDRLIGADSPVAGRVEVHEMTMDGTVMRMRALPDGLALPAGQAVLLAPGGFHVMLMDLKQPLVAGQTIGVRLRFQHAPPLDLQVPVMAIGAAGPGAPAGMNHGAMPGHTR